MKLVEQERSTSTRMSRPGLADPAQPRLPDRPITLRQLLSHTSPCATSVINMIPLGDSVQATMAAPTSWDLKHGPGAGYFTYSNFNFPIVASIVERVTGERFDLWMRREVIEPMKLDACYNWPTCSDVEEVARAVVLTQGGQAGPRRPRRQAPGLPGVRRQGPMRSRPLEARRERPFAPQGGLRISMNDLARVGRMLLNGGTLDGIRILSPKSVETMLAPEGGSTAATAKPTRASIAPTGSPFSSSPPECRAARTIPPATASSAWAMRATLTVCAPACGSTACMG